MDCRRCLRFACLWLEPGIELTRQDRGARPFLEAAWQVAALGGSGQSARSALFLPMWAQSLPAVASLP
jgi:hypothetical protein